MDYLALLGTGIVIALAYGLRRAYRAAQKVLQGHYEQGYINGLAQAGRLAYVQGHEDGPGASGPGADDQRGKGF